MAGMIRLVEAMNNKSVLITDFTTDPFLTFLLHLIQKPTVASAWVHVEDGRKCYELLGFSDGALRTILETIPYTKYLEFHEYIFHICMNIRADKLRDELTAKYFEYPQTEEYKQTVAALEAPKPPVQIGYVPTLNGTIEPLIINASLPW